MPGRDGAVTHRMIAGVSFVVLAAGLGACSGEDSAPQEAAEPTVLTADGTTPIATEGEDYRVTGRLLGRIGDRSAAFSGWLEDGTEIYHRTGSVFDIIRRPGTVDQRQVALMARDPESGSLRVISDRAKDMPELTAPLAHGYSYHAVTPIGRRVLWVEGYAINLGDLRVYDFETDQETLLVSAKDAGAGKPPWPTGMADPVVVGDTVYFIGYSEATVDEARSASGATALYAVPIDGSGTPTEIAPRAEEVFAAPDGLLDVVFHDRMVRWDPAKGTDGELADTSVPGVEHFANEAGVRMSHEEKGEPIVIESPEHGRFEISVGEPGSVYLVGSERWAAFTSSTTGDTAAFLLDMARGELRRVKDAKIAWNPAPLTPATYIPRTESEIAPKTRPVIELVPAA